MKRKMVMVLDCLEGSGTLLKISSKGYSSSNRQLELYHFKQPFNKLRS